MTKISKKEKFYDTIADKFDSIMNHYESDKRVALIFKHFLKNFDLKNKKLLDVGSGTGRFSQQAFLRGASVTSLDVGKNILKEVAKKCPSRLVVGTAIDIPFPDNTFDFVICTEVVEHTPDPEKAMREIIRVAKPNGKIIFSVPNKIWKFSLWIANLLKIRPYYGNENWQSWWAIKKAFGKNTNIDEILGFNIIPWFHPKLQPIITYFDRFGDSLGPIMVNIGLIATKKS